MQNKLMAVAGLLVLIGIGSFVAYASMHPKAAQTPTDGTPYAATLSGTYGCLPHLDTTGPQTEECAFGIQTDDGDYYAVNFGQSADAMTQFQSGAHVRAEGNIVPKEALNSDQWQKYNMKGIFTVTQVLEVSTSTPPASNQKLNINAVCQGALAYMTFNNGADADKFVAECEAGEHPEVIEKYKTDHNLNGATI